MADPGVNHGSLSDDPLPLHNLTPQPQGFPLPLTHTSLSALSFTSEATMVSEHAPDGYERTLTITASLETATTLNSCIVPTSTPPHSPSLLADTPISPSSRSAASSTPH